jgi:hypothetical protein
MGHFKQIEIALIRSKRSDLMLLVRPEYRAMVFPDDMTQSGKCAFCVNYLLEKYPEPVPRPVRVKK